MSLFRWLEKVCGVNIFFSAVWGRFENMTWLGELLLLPY